MSTARAFVADILYQDSLDTTPGALGDLLEYSAATKPYCVEFRDPPKDPQLPLLTYSMSSEQAGQMQCVDLWLSLTAYGDNFNEVLARAFSLIHKKIPLTASDYSLKSILYDSGTGDMYDDNLQAYWSQNRYRIMAIKL